MLATARRLDANEERSQPGEQPQSETIVVFRNANSGNERKFFHEIVGKSEVVRAALRDMTRPRFLPQPTGRPHIAIHVRGGDFQSSIDTSIVKGGRHNLRLSIEWYVDILTGLRERLGEPLSATLYSECADAELAPLLTQSAIERSSHKDAITDMLAMSEASALISSGLGFSRWGSYLGQVPRLCFPGQGTIRTLDPVMDGLDLEPECEVADEIPAQFSCHIMLRNSGR